MRKLKYLIAVPVLALALMGSSKSCTSDDRLEDLETVCSDREGVVALDDGVVVCGDQSVHEIEVSG